MSDVKRVAFALALSAMLLLATWVQAPAAPARDITNPTAEETQSAEQAAQAVVPAARQVDEEADRLRMRLAAQVPFSAPARDPFRFTAPPPVPTRTSVPVAVIERTPEPVVLNTPVSPAISMPTVLALTEDTVAGVVVRSAMLSMGDDTAIVKIGQTFARFQVQQISATSVELVDVTSPTRLVTTISIR